MGDNILNNIVLFYPEITLVVTLCALVFSDLLMKGKGQFTGWLLLGGFCLTGIFLLLQNGYSESVFDDMFAVDSFGIYFKVILILSGIFIVLFTMRSRELERNMQRIGEYYMLIAGMMLGMFLMVGSTNVLLMYLAFEMTSISSYVLTGYIKGSLKSAEASMKYIIFGAVSSGIMLYGLSLLCGVTGATDIYAINASLVEGVGQPMVLSTAVLMIIVGLGFKIAVVPFHFWAPDVYEGAPLVITAFLAVASKIAAFAMLIRLFSVSFLVHVADTQSTGLLNVIEGLNWNIVLSGMSALAMIVGNLAALWQTNIKRLLAYSSIAHAGYILMGIVVLTEEARSAMMMYIFIYLFMNLGAFYIAMLFSNKLNSESIEDYKGLGFRAPFESVAMTVFMIALAGLPPTAGFIAKLYIFGAAMNAGWLWLVFIAGVTAVISLFYYIRIVRNMFLYNPEGESGQLYFDVFSKVIVLLLLIPTLFLGVYFGPLIKLARTSINIFGM